MSVHKWFVVAQYGTRDHEGVTVPAPGSITHAKEMGTTRTACGVPCGSWLKWWEHAFPMASVPACPQCLLACASRAAGTRERSRGDGHRPATSSGERSLR